MLKELHRQQLRYVPIYCVASVAAGSCLGFAWAGNFLPWWQRALLVLLLLPFGAIIGHACNEALHIVRQLISLRAMERANPGPIAMPLQTPSAGGNNTSNGWDIFGGRPHG